MLLSTIATSLVLALAANPPPASGPPAPPLPRSSIAAVLAHRGELGLSDAQVMQLEARDAALQMQIVELRQRLATPRAPGRSPDGRSATPDEGRPSPLSPTAGAERTGGGSGRHGGEPGGRHGEERSGMPPQDPTARAAALQSRIDDADTAAWLSAESVLEASQRERAREVAEKYRETLADEREADRARRK